MGSFNKYFILLTVKNYFRDNSRNRFFILMKNIKSDLDVALISTNVKKDFFISVCSPDKIMSWVQNDENQFGFSGL